MKLNSKENNIWGYMWMAILWALLDQMNKIIFRSELVDALEVFTLAQLKTWGG